MRFVEKVARQPDLAREQTLQRLSGFPLTALLPEQQRLVEVYRAEYFRVGSSTEPADRDRAERAITALYAEHGHAPPRFEWGPSPSWRTDRVTALGDSMGVSLWESLVESLVESLGYSLFGSLVSTLGMSLTGSLREALWESLWSSLGTALRESMESSLCGNQDAYWVAQHIYGNEVLCLPYSSESVHRLYLHDETVHSCGAWWPYKKLCLCSDRPEHVECTEDQPPKIRIVRYRDGWEVGKP